MTANTRKLNTLKNWDKNPRAIKTEDFARLKNQIQTLGLYKPFLITSDGTVLGGNMRLRACKELGVDEVPVSVVQADTDELKLQYALSDNDRAGYYDEQALAELVLSMPDIDLQDYKIDLGNLISIDELMARLTVDGYGEDFTLPDGDKPGFQQMTFTIADEQVAVIKDAIASAKGLNLETYDNENSNGNAIYWICKQWLQQKTS